MIYYFDMDGVLVDREAFFTRMLGEGSPQAERDALFDRIYSLSLFTDVAPNHLEAFRSLFRKLAAQGNEVQILTSYGPHGGPLDMGLIAHMGKAEWLKRYYGDLFAEGTIKKFNGVLDCSQKQFYCSGPDDLLIDDQEDNVTQWRNRGGKAILYSSDRHEDGLSR